jgi:hypothetical protein
MTGGVDSQPVILNDRDGVDWAIYPYAPCPACGRETPHAGPYCQVNNCGAPNDVTLDLGQRVEVKQGAWHPGTIDAEGPYGVLRVALDAGEGVVWATPRHIRPLEAP